MKKGTYLYKFLNILKVILHLTTGVKAKNGIFCIFICRIYVPLQRTS